MRSGVREYALVTGTYWAFTLTDGALRTLILLYLHTLGYGPFALATLFLFYEFFGVMTNLLGGWLGARYGLNRTLTTGLTLQIAACGILALRADALSVPLVMACQGMSGIAKDLVKMSSKSFVKLVVATGDSGRLLRWVAWITGSKNSLKGLGLLLGGVLLAAVGFRWACIGMAAVLAPALASASLLLAPAAGRSATKPALSSVFSDDPRINWLAAGRFFLFGARDFWFAVALPVFLATELGWSFPKISGFLALWIVGYGMVQALTPRVLGRGATVAGARQLLGWTLPLTLPLGAVAWALREGFAAGPTLIGGLMAFGVLFAINSALHSFLIVAYAESEKIAMRNWLLLHGERRWPSGGHPRIGRALPTGRPGNTGAARVPGRLAGLHRGLGGTLSAATQRGAADQCQDVPRDGVGAPAATPGLRVGTVPGVARLGDPVQVVPPHRQVGLAGPYDLIFHRELRGKAGHGVPPQIGVLGVGRLVKREEVELLVRETEQLAPSFPFQPKPTPFPKHALAVTRHVGPLHTGVRDDPLEPMAVAHQRLPGKPAELGARERFRRLDLRSTQADVPTEFLDDLPVCATAAVFVIGDDLLGARFDNREFGVPVGAVGGHPQLEHRIALSGVEAVLKHEGARAAGGHRLPEKARVAAKGVDHAIHATKDPVFIAGGGARAHRKLLASGVGHPAP